LKQVEIDELVAQLNVSTVLARILVARGVDSVEKAQAFLFPSLRDHLPDPQGIKNIATAAEMMLEAIEAGQQITIYSDFDVDGLSSGAQLDLYLSALGGIVNRYTPNRFTEGYGVVKSAIEKLGRARTELLITVDCGISSLSEIALAKRLGMKVIVVDHHYSQELPPADVIVNPTQPGCEFKEHQLCAAGLVWMLLIVLRQCARTRSSTELQQRLSQLPDPKDFLDLAALGTICDMVPLTGLNRIIASRGVEVFRVTKRPGLEALKVVSGLDKSKNLALDTSLLRLVLASMLQDAWMMPGRCLNFSRPKIALRHRQSRSRSIVIIANEKVLKIRFAYLALTPFRRSPRC